MNPAILRAFGRAASKRGLSTVPKSLRQGLDVGDVRKAYKGYERQAKERGLDSIAAWPFIAMANKAVGKDKVEKFLWKRLSEPALRADTATGNLLRKIPGGKGLFKIKEDIPWGSGKLKRTIERSSALAPLTKVKDVAMPIIIGTGLGKGVEKAVELSKGQKKEAMKKELLEKVATTMTRLHEENKGHRKQARAINILYKQAELGVDDFPRTYSEFQEKLGMLLREDLDVYEKALEINVGKVSLGTVGQQQDLGSLNATEQFHADILGVS